MIALATAIATGVLPEPPTVSPPTQITLGPVRYGVLCAAFHATLAPYRYPIGERARERRREPVSLRNQNSGVCMFRKEVIDSGDGLRHRAAECRRAVRSRVCEALPELSVGEKTFRGIRDLAGRAH